MAIERSRSGNGAHAWFFFAEAVAASHARRMVSFVPEQILPVDDARFVPVCSRKSRPEAGKGLPGLNAQNHGRGPWCEFTGRERE